ncbi:MAG: hypothetical protein E6J18_10500 [Chloroflexi bacterium]|nr:MAG: hypothetical protein E6J37_13770 [Chloroflexota bacterium]TMC70273.1 MAG: hypothetical protein E6J18_10500 [Chloroflexota bacterium]
MNVSAYDAGFWVGNVLYILVLVLIFRFVGRWGWIGLIIRIICGGLLIFRVVTLLAIAPRS